MSKTALILVDFQTDNITVGGDDPIKRLKMYDPVIPVDMVVASRKYAANICKKGTKGARLNPYVTRMADVIVTKEAVGPSAFEGGTLRPIERILKIHGITRVVVGGYFLEWTVAQTAFDANALGYDTSVDLSMTVSEAGDVIPVVDFGMDTIFARLERAGVGLIAPATILPVA